MNISPNSQNQFEFFPHAVSQHQESGRPKFLLRSLTLEAENLIVICIIFVMIMVLSFSVGVERGRRLIAREISPQQDSIVVVSDPSPLTPVVSPATKGEGAQAAVTAPIPVKRKTLKVPAAEQDIINSGYTIQVASFKQESRAQKEASGLKTTGYQPFVLAKGSYSIVCVGKFAQKDEATKVSHQLKPKYKDLLVRRF
jgi:hypothetical protein